MTYLHLEYNFFREVVCKACVGTQSGVAKLLAIILAVSAGGVSAVAGPPADDSSEPPAAQFRRALPQPRIFRGPTIQTDRGTQTSSSHKVQLITVEVVQGIQNPAGRVQILAGRDTYIRMYFNLDGPEKNSTSVKVSGKARLTSPNGTTRDLINEFSEFNPHLSGSQNSDLNAQRSDAISGLVFRVPGSDVQLGRYKVQLLSITDVDTNEVLDCTNCASFLADFQSARTAPVFRVTVIGVSYKYKGDMYEPREIDFASVRSWLKRGFPVSEIVFDWRTVAYPNPLAHPPLSESKAADEFDCKDVNAFLADIRQRDIEGGTDPRTHYLGLVFDGDKPNPFPWLRGCAAMIPDEPNPNATASAPAGKKFFRWDDSGSYAGWYGAHELAHTLGRKHVGGACNESGLDLRYPYPEGNVSSSEDRHATFDPGDTIEGRVIGPLAILGQPNTSGLNAHDIMSYCKNVWSSAYTYNLLHERIAAENSLFGPPLSAEPNIPVAGPAPMALAGSQPAAAGPTNSGAVLTRSVPPRDGERFLNVIVQVEQGWEKARIVSVAASSNGAVPTRTSPSESLLLETLAKDGHTVSKYPVRLLEFSDESRGLSKPSSKPAGLINTTIPAGIAVAGLRITHAGVTLAQSNATQEKPELSESSARSLTQVRGLNGVNAGPERPTILSWESKHSIANLTYSVQLSADDGKTWQTVAANIKEPKLEITSKQLSSKARQAYTVGAPIKYKLTAGDGFNSTTLVGDLP